MANPKRKGFNVPVLLIGLVLAVGCAMALTGSTLTPTKSLVFTAVVAAFTAVMFRKIVAVVGAVVVALVLCFLIAPHIPGLTG